jgi:hypothetical protein
MITVGDVRARIETGFDDPVIQRMINAAYEAIEERHGAPTQVTDRFRACGADKVVLTRKADTIVEVRVRPYPTASLVVLDPVEYRLWGPMILTRVVDTWEYEVEVDYIPHTNSELRDRVALDLVQLDVEFRAFGSEQVGDWRGDQSDYAARREYVLNQIREPSRGIT